MAGRRTDPYLNTAQVAARLGWSSPSSVHSAVCKGRVPPPDDRGDLTLPANLRSNRWRTSTIDHYLAQRPGQGARTDLKGWTRPQTPAMVTTRLRRAQMEALAELQVMAEQAIAEGNRPWDGRGNRGAISDTDLIEDVEWMLNGATTLDEAAERLGMTTDALRSRLTKRPDLLAKLRANADTA